MTKRAYCPPKLSRFQAMVFSELAWESPDEDEPFRRLHPFYLVYRKQEVMPLAVRLRFEGDDDYHDWQAIGVVSALFSGESREEARHGWLLLGYVSPGVPFEAQLMCRDKHGRHGVAAARNLIADENKPFELAYFEVPSLASTSADGNPSLWTNDGVAAPH